MTDNIRSFDTGATRSPDTGRYDPEGYLSPIVIERFAQYMQKHQIASDGSLRASDNWQKGIPIDAYMKGMWRHFLHLWTRHRGYAVQDPGATDNVEEDLCSILFNAQGFLFELLKAKQEQTGVGVPISGMPVPQPPSWIEWHGGSFPAGLRTVDSVKILCRDGLERTMVAGYVWWGRDAAECAPDGEVVAYQKVST